MADGKGMAMVQLLDSLHKKSGLKVDTIVETGDKITACFKSPTGVSLFRVGYNWYNNKWRTGVVRSHIQDVVQEILR